MVEILVVIGIIGILSSIGLGAFVTSQKRSRDVRRKSNLAQIARALELYQNDYSIYPSSDENGNIVGCVDSPDGSPVACAWDGQHGFSTYINGQKTTYMPILPSDPNSLLRYKYQVSVDRKSYVLMSVLEVTQDKDYFSDIPICGPNGGETCQCNSSGSSVVCNYQLTEAGVLSPSVSPSPPQGGGPGFE